MIVLFYKRVGLKTDDFRKSVRIEAKTFGFLRVVLFRKLFVPDQKNISLDVNSTYTENNLIITCNQVKLDREVRLIKIQNLYS